ncbi:discoidin domain-containing receptor 2-like isoform X1 [Cotesia glomerata]|uniref:discoidin domain-containing receptor 2-like isoform X1 n=1 Tax=Cotesia glomerata TaxID=32391 RepID=UPI001D00356B|nr:discoidin domain-containing receptor 2-like isoform X1 [Cotesia glomerata]
MRNSLVGVNLVGRFALLVLGASIVTWCYAASTSPEHQIKNASAQCVLPLGMEEGKIPDDAISASSSYETKSVGPQNARIRQEKNGGAWCPKAQISNDIREYLEIDLTTNHLITWTETQGRFGNGQGQEYAEAFFLEYWRNSKWYQYKTLSGDKILRGNSNTYLVERQKLELPFVASRVRFVPYSQHPRTVCMRVEIYGCMWEQRIVKYKIPRGVTFGPGGSNVEDTSYDGRTDIDAKYLIDGLGQLVDGMLGEDPRVSSTLAHWVGWTDINPVPLVFEFSDLREFNMCVIYAANAPVRGIEVFKNLKIWFSNDGESYDPSSIEVSVEEKSPYSPGIIPIVVSLKSRLGRFIKLELEPRSKWLLVSEISFESFAGSRFGNSSEEGPLDTVSTAQNDSITTEDPSESSFNEFNITDSDSNGNQTPDAFPVSPRWSQTYIGLVSGALTVLLLLLTCTVVLMKLRGRNKVALLQKHTALLCGSTAPGITINVKDLKLPTPIVVNGTQSRLTGSFKGSSSKLRSSSMSSYDAATLMRDHMQQSHSCDMASEYEHRSVYAESTYKLLFPEERFSGSKTDYADVAEFASESVNSGTAGGSTTSSAKVCGGNSTVALPEAETNERPQPQTPYAHRSSKHHGYSSKGHKVYEGYYAATDILTTKFQIKRREQHTGSSLFTSLLIEDYYNQHQHHNHNQHHHHQHQHAVDNYDIQHISRHRLRILDKIGEGSFGFVHLCEAKGIHSPDLGTMRNRQLVIVRSLWRGVTDSLKKDFMRDMYVLAKIRDPNITRIVALVEEEPFGAVFEYGELGDLPDFIRNREKSDNEAPLSYNRLLKFITHIASGMRYLESLNIAHCDLAARNCVVGKNLSIKVSDHAMYCSKYDSEYYVNECYTKIPLRWMAWEAVLLSKRSCQADVWSYATTVWEILTYCEDLPFSEMTSEQVLENCGNWYHSTSTSTTTSSSSSQDKKTRVLSQPATCSRDLYRMMTKCWSKHAEERPSFEDIYVFLKRLTLNE